MSLYDYIFGLGGGPFLEAGIPIKETLDVKNGNWSGLGEEGLGIATDAAVAGGIALGAGAAGGGAAAASSSAPVAASPVDAGIDAGTAATSSASTSSPASTGLSGASKAAILGTGVSAITSPWQKAQQQNQQNQSSPVSIQQTQLQPLPGEKGLYDQIFSQLNPLNPTQTRGNFSSSITSDQNLKTNISKNTTISNFFLQIARLYQ